LDVDLDGYAVAVEWQPRRGVGITANPSSGYGEGPDEVYPDVAAAQQRVVALLLSRTKTKPPPATLRGLRKARQVTQLQLAERLSVQQASVAKLERRSDMLLSPLHAVISAMGGRLIIRATFPDGMEKELVFFERPGRGEG